MTIQYGVIFAYVVGIFLLYAVGKLFLVPIKILLKLIYNAVVGGIAIFLINLAGSFFGFSIALNVLSAFIVGFLGIPGIILLIVLKIIFKA